MGMVEGINETLENRGVTPLEDTSELVEGGIYKGVIKDPVEGIREGVPVMVLGRSYEEPSHESFPLSCTRRDTDVLAAENVPTPSYVVYPALRADGQRADLYIPVEDDGTIQHQHSHPWVFDRAVLEASPEEQHRFLRKAAEGWGDGQPLPLLIKDEESYPPALHPTGDAAIIRNILAPEGPDPENRYRYGKGLA